MSQNNVIDLKKPEPFVEDPLTDILRQGARQLLTAALEAEIRFFLNQYFSAKFILGAEEVDMHYSE